MKRRHLLLLAPMVFLSSCGLRPSLGRALPPGSTDAPDLPATVESTTVQDSARGSTDTSTVTPNSSPLPLASATPQATDTAAPKTFPDCEDLSTYQLTTTSEWRIFKSWSGWKVRYPPGWGASSCTMCSDPTEAGLFVDFFDMETYGDEGWIMVEGFWTKPAGNSDEEILSGLTPCGYQYPVVSDEICTISGKLAKKLVTTGWGRETENYFIAGPTKLFEISFQGDHAAKVKDLKNYPIFQLMMSTFEEVPT
jgi:hypothetical protein